VLLRRPGSTDEEGAVAEEGEAIEPLELDDAGIAAEDEDALADRPGGRR